LGKEFNEFINNRSIVDQVDKIVQYRPEAILILLDSEFTRRTIYYKYSHMMPFLSGSLEKNSYSIVCSIDQTDDNYGARELLQKYNKPLLITGIGLYGQMFIRDVRMFERVTGPEVDRCPIVLMGSPRPEKIESLQGQYDLIINNLCDDVFLKLDWILAKVIQSCTDQ